jgi:hypothetical protein
MGEHRSEARVEGEDEREVEEHPVSGHRVGDRIEGNPVLPRAGEPGRRDFLDAGRSREKGGRIPPTADEPPRGDREGRQEQETDGETRS